MVQAASCGSALIKGCANLTTTPAMTLENPTSVHQHKSPWIGLEATKYNRLFHARLRYLPGAVIARDVTSGVHSCAILGYFCTAVNGKCSLL